jgi:hypothetical protein
MKLFFLSFLFIQLSAFACPPCPSGASYSGTGANTTTAGCKCVSGSYTWNGSICTPPATCPSGSSTSGTGVTTNVPGCRCTNTSHVFNGSICTAATPCPAESKTWTVSGLSCTASTTSITSGSQVVTDSVGTETGSATYTCNSGTWSAPSSTSCTASCSPNGAIRSNPSNGAAEVCSGGSWAPRSVSTYCLPPSIVYFDDDEWMHFHQNLYRAQNSNCDLGQRLNSNGTDLNNPALGVHSDDAYKPCKNTNSCLQNESAPVGGASCPAKTLAWSQGSFTCYASVGVTSHGSYISINDTVPSVYGTGNARCTAGVWLIYPSYCGSQPVNCTGTYDPYYTSWNCNSGGASVAQCCDPYSTGSCQGYSASCP